MESQQCGITLRMTKSIYETFQPRVELLDDWADLRGSRSLLEVSRLQIQRNDLETTLNLKICSPSAQVMPPHHTVLSPLLRLWPEEVDFPTPIEAG